MLSVFTPNYLTCQPASLQPVSFTLTPKEDRGKALGAPRHSRPGSRRWLCTCGAYSIRYNAITIWVGMCHVGVSRAQRLGESATL
jgi:hypothetical protein